MLRGREEECLLTLARLRNLEPEDFAVQSEYMSLQAERLVEEDAMKERYGSKASWKVGALEYMRLVRNWPLCRRLLLAVAAQSLQQWTGINAISEFFALYERPLLIVFPVQSTMLLPVCLA